MQRDLPTSDIAAMGRQNERWRFSAEHESSPNPRDSALAAALRGGATQSPDSCDVPDASFPEILPEVWGEGWHFVSSHPWSRSEPQVVLEGRSMVFAVKHTARNCRAFGKRHLFLGESMAPILAVSKGRSSCPGMLRVCRQTSAVVLATFLYRAWVS